MMIGSLLIIASTAVYCCSKTLLGVGSFKNKLIRRDLGTFHISCLSDFYGGPFWGDTQKRGKTIKIELQ